MAFRPDRLSDLIETKKMTQEELASDVGVSDRMIRNYLTGQSVPGGDRLTRLVTALETNEDYLFDRSDDPHPNLHLTDDERAFILWLRSLPGEPTPEQIDDFIARQHAAKKPRPRSAR